MADFIVLCRSPPHKKMLLDLAEDSEFMIAHTDAAHTRKAIVLYPHPSVDSVSGFSGWISPN
jgi:hypothetical protein